MQPVRSMPWLKCEFLEIASMRSFEGVISAVTTFGVFVELSDLYIEGLMHVSALPGDYYHFDQAKQRLIGERTRQVFQLGGAVTVRIARVDLEDRKIDLEQVSRLHDGVRTRDVKTTMQSAHTLACQKRSQR